jgi:hypothetical protein
MSIELTTKYAPQTDELFKAESKISLLTNTDFDWTGAHAIKIYKLSTAPMNDYSRNRDSATVNEDSAETLSRYGKLLDLSATTEELLLKHDRSFIFNIDRLDEDETQGQLEAGTALARELREVVVPEVDANVYTVMTSGAGNTPSPAALTAKNIYPSVLAASQALDDAEVPETERVLVVTPATYALLKQAAEFDNTEIGAEMRARGVVAMLDGAAVVKVPAVRLPEKFGFMLAHPSATVAPVKLEDFGIHNDTPLSSGTIVTGRVCYDAFVLDNKKSGIYYQSTT